MASDDTPAEDRLKYVDPRASPLPPPPEFAEPGFDDVGYYRVPEAKRLFDALEAAGIAYQFRTFPGDGYHGQPILLLVSTDTSRRDDVHRIHGELFGHDEPI